MNALFLGGFPKTWPDSFSDAVNAGTEYCVGQYGGGIWKPTQWSSFPTHIPVPDHVVVNKNDLMKDIVENNNLELYKQYKSIFSDAEKQLLDDKIEKAPD